MTAKKFDWSSVGGRAQEATKPQTEAFDWESVGGRPHEEKSQKGWAGVGQDVLSSIKKIPDIIGSIPGQISGIKQQYKEEPSRIGKNLLAGAGEVGEALFNTPHDVIKYLGKKDLIPESLKKYNELPFTHIPNLGIEEKMLGEEKPGDAMLKLIPQIMSGYAAKKILGEPSLKALEQTVAKEKNLIEKTTEHHKKFLGEGEEHGAKLSQKIVDLIEGKEVTEPHQKTGLPREVRKGGLREEIGNKYDMLEKGLPEVEIPGTPDMKAIEKEFKSLVGSKALSDENKEAFKQVLASTHPSAKGKMVSGKEFFRAYRSLRKMENNERSKAYSGLSPQDHDAWIARANKTKQTYEDMENIINEHFPKDTLKKLHEINHEYSNKVAPLSENSLYQEMRKHGQTSKNIIKYLHGNTKGNKILNSLVEKDPELQRLVVGQEYASKPGKLINEPEAVKKYQKLNPFVSKIIEEQKNIKHSKENVIPHLQKAIEKAEKKKIHRKGVRHGLGIAGASLGASYLLGNDIKKDLPFIAAIRGLIKGK